MGDPLVLPLTKFCLTVLLRDCLVTNFWKTQSRLRGREEISWKDSGSLTKLKGRKNHQLPEGLAMRMAEQLGAKAPSGPLPPGHFAGLPTRTVFLSLHTYFSFLWISFVCSMSLYTNHCPKQSTMYAEPKSWLSLYPSSSFPGEFVPGWVQW